MSPRFLLVLQLAAYWPVWRWYAERVQDGSDDPWGLLALITALLYASKNLRWATISKRQIAAPCSIAIVYLLGYHMWPPLIRALLAFTAIALTCGSMIDEKKFHLGLIGLFILSLPLIASLQFFLGFPLRALTAWISASLISIFWMPVSASGTSLSWAGEIISVDSPCSGIRMLWCGLYISFTLSCIFGLSNFHTWLSYLITLPLVFMTNLARSTVLFFPEAGVISNPHWLHQSVGLISFTICAILIFIMHLLIVGRKNENFFCRGISVRLSSLCSKLQEAQ